MILGIDEVGRGPWAGPLVVGAVVLGGITIDGLTDSKKLSKKRREELDTIIREQAVGYGLGWVHADEIDRIGLSHALKEATKRAVDDVKASYHEIIIDGTINFLDGTTKGKYVTTMPKADLLVPSVSAASIIAKVARDNFMKEQDDIYEGYQFASHVGYGTAAHRAAIEKNGITPLHRLSFAPLKKYAPLEVTLAAPPVDSEIARTTKLIGDRAEAIAADYLKSQGHEILWRNWRTKRCEIDIISREDGTIVFTEVKYRRNNYQGDGVAAITPRKLAQMEFAAEYFTQVQRLTGFDRLLAVIPMSGEPPVIDDYIVLT